MGRSGGSAASTWETRPCHHSAIASIPRLKYHESQQIDAPMQNALIFDAPPVLYDEIADILDAADYTYSRTICESRTTGVRRLDIAGYDISHGNTTVHVGIEHRLGNHKLTLMIIPNRRSFWRRDRPSEQLAERIASVLKEYGAQDPA